MGVLDGKRVSRDESMNLGGGLVILTVIWTGLTDVKRGGHGGKSQPTFGRLQEICMV